jgi:hypothetical protein
MKKMRIGAQLGWKIPVRSTVRGSAEAGNVERTNLKEQRTTPGSYLHNAS